jgi:uncharacterized membrane protein (DUF4010 family)
MELLVGFTVALAVGVLIGIERERRKRDPAVGSAGGLRTHVIAALAGAIAVQFPGVAVLVAGAVFVGALVVVAYWRSRSADPGLTSEITLFTTYLLGAMAPRLPELAAAIGVVMALLLALRSFLHGLVSKALSDREVLDLLLLAAAALVIWPLMPDRSIDRYGVINPQAIWELTLLVLLLNAVGYVALRRFGPTRGLPLAGFFGGFVSSAATIAAMGTRSRTEPTIRQHALAAALLSSVATPLQLLIVLGVINRELFFVWLLPASVMALVAAGSAGFWLRGAGSPSDHVRQTFEGRAFQPLQAFVFSITVTSLLWAAAWLAAQFGSLGAAWGVMLGGFADAHSAIASAATLVRAAELDAATGVLAIFGALASNTLMKLLVACATGGRSYAAALAVPLIAMLLVAAALLLSPSWLTAAP